MRMLGRGGDGKRRKERRIQAEDRERGKRGRKGSPGQGSHIWIHGSYMTGTTVIDSSTFSPNQLRDIQYRKTSCSLNQCLILQLTCWPRNNLRTQTTMPDLQAPYERARETEEGWLLIIALMSSFRFSQVL